MHVAFSNTGRNTNTQEGTLNSYLYYSLNNASVPSMTLTILRSLENTETLGLAVLLKSLSKEEMGQKRECHVGQRGCRLAGQDKEEVCWG